MTDHYDVIVIGSGAGGGTLTHALAPTGTRILLLERGDWLPREVENWSPKASVARPALPQRRQVDRPERQASSPPSSTTTSAATPSSTARSCSGSANATSAPSPTSTASRRPGRCRYADFEPYYTRAEQLYHVHGERGVDPTEPPAASPYPYPGDQRRAAHRAAARRPERRRAATVPAADRDPASTRRRPQISPCIRCATCDGYPCLANGKADAAGHRASSRRCATRTSRCSPTRGSPGWRPAPRRAHRHPRGRRPQR